MRFRGDRVRGLIDYYDWTLGELHLKVKLYRRKTSWSTFWEAIEGNRQVGTDIMDAFASALVKSDMREGKTPGEVRALERAMGAYLMDLADDPAPTGANTLPVAEIDIAELVRRLNAMPAELRTKVSAGVLPLLDMLIPPPVHGVMSETEFYRLLKMWPESDWPELVSRFEAEVAERARRARGESSHG